MIRLPKPLAPFPEGGSPVQSVSAHRCRGESESFLQGRETLLYNGKLQSETDSAFGNAERG